MGVQLRLDSGIPDKFIIWLTYSQIFTMFMWWQVIITDYNLRKTSPLFARYVYYYKLNICKKNFFFTFYVLHTF